MSEKILQAQDSTSLEPLYEDAVKLVRSSIHERIEKGPIEELINRVADAFKNDLYNPLLLLFYKESKDNFLYAHIANSMIWTVAFATSMGLSRQDIFDAGCCALGHDFGMMDYLKLFQKPAQLTSEEKQSLNLHPEKSAELFKGMFPPRVIDGILDVHEYVDGRGYPKGKTASQISYLAKIVCVCDIFEALTHSRNYRHQFNPYTALKMIVKKQGKMFEKIVIKKFVEFTSIYPVGCRVMLNTGEAGIVVASNPGHPTRAVIHMLTGDSKELKYSGKTINLLHDHLLYVSSVIDTPV